MLDPLDADTASPRLTQLGRHVVHPTSFSQDDDAAFHHALRLSLAARGQLDLVHINPRGLPHGAQWDAFPGVRSTLARWGCLPGGALPSDVAALGLGISKFDLGRHFPAGALVDFIGDRGADLIVMASDSRRDGVFARSVSKPVARRSRLPSLFIPAGATGFIDGTSGETRMRHILVPVGGRVNPQAAILAAIDLAEQLEQLPVLHLLQVGAALAFPVDLVTGTLTAQRLVRGGPVAAAIVSAAAEVEADLIVMATQGHDSLGDWAFGDTTERVLTAASRALLAVPARS